MRGNKTSFASHIASLLVVSAVALPSNGYANASIELCLVKELKHAAETTTVAELRQRCNVDSQVNSSLEHSIAQNSSTEGRGSVDQRRRIEATLADQPFSITAHQPNYLMTTYSERSNHDPFIELSGDSTPVEESEIVFQVSIKAPVWRNALGSRFDLFAAYTAKSWWQLFADDFSAPFRETNYQPELFLRTESDINIPGTRLVGWDLGFNHESNGRSDPLSRSWNRIMARGAFQVTDDLSLFARAWYRLPEEDEDNDNPGMHQYYGYGDVRAVWTPNQNTFTALFRPGTKEFSYELCGVDQSARHLESLHNTTRAMVRAF